MFHYHALPSTLEAPVVNNWFYRIEKFWEQVHQRLEAVTCRTKEFADRCHGETPRYHLGDKILLSDFCCKIFIIFLAPRRTLSTWDLIKLYNILMKYVNTKLLFLVTVISMPNFKSYLKPFISGPLTSYSLASVLGQ